MFRTNLFLAVCVIASFVQGLAHTVAAVVLAAVGLIMMAQLFGWFGF